MFKKFQGLYEKAEALYAMGEFELALVFFHRGKKIRSDVREFQLGINKAQEAIDNCVGGENLILRQHVSMLLYHYPSQIQIVLNQKSKGICHTSRRQMR